MFLQQYMNQQIRQNPQSPSCHSLKIRKQPPDNKEIQFQTDSSVYDNYGKVNSKEDNYKEKILQLQKTIGSTLFKYQAKIEQERIRLKRLKEKKLDMENEQRRLMDIWKNSVQQISSLAQVFVIRIKEMHQSQIVRIQKYYDLCIEQLSEKLEQERRKREEVLEKMEQMQKQNREEKQKVKQFVTQFLRSENNINQIQISLKKKLELIKQTIRQKREMQNKQLNQVAIYLSQVRNLLLKQILKERIHRQIHKEKILQYFENLFVSID